MKKVSQSQKKVVRKELVIIKKSGKTTLDEDSTKAAIQY
jgi:hypothetical protein